MREWDTAGDEPKSARSNIVNGDNASVHSAGQKSQGAKSQAITDTGAIDNDDEIYKAIAAAKRKRENENAVRLCDACAKGDMGLVNRLLLMDVSVNTPDYDAR